MIYNLKASLVICSCVISTLFITSVFVSWLREYPGIDGEQWSYSFLLVTRMSFYCVFLKIIFKINTCKYFVFWIVPLRRTSHLSPLVNLQITVGMSSQYIGFSRELRLWVRVGPGRWASEAGFARTPVCCFSYFLFHRL